MKKRVFSGARPTGRQHLGNYLGALQNWVRLQDEYDCIYCIVDIHALTTLEDTSTLQQNILDMSLDWLAAGIDPKRSILFVQSHVPEVMELHTLLGMITPLSWLLRVPTFKDKAKQQPHNVNYGLVGYPVLMTSDIVLYKAEAIPVGEDQLPHLELAREIVRRFTVKYGYVFPEPAAKLTSFPSIRGLDGKDKMSKSQNNYIEIAASPAETRERVMKAVTDPERRYRNDPGHPEICNIFTLHKYFNPHELDKIELRCRKADIGCVACKELLTGGINTALEPFRQKRVELAGKPDYVRDVLADGARRAQTIARQTLGEVKQKMGLI